jgi:hypothetical protein
MNEDFLGGTEYSLCTSLLIHCQCEFPNELITDMIGVDPSMK